MGERVTGPKSYFPSIEQRYGEPVEHWFAQLRQLGEAPHMEQVAHLKSLGLGHGHANALVHVFRSEHSEL